MSGWGCKHQSGDTCNKVGGPCQPGMRGCVLCGRVVFVDRKGGSRQRSTPAGKRRRSTTVAKQVRDLESDGDQES